MFGIRRRFTHVLVLLVAVSLLGCEQATIAEPEAATGSDTIVDPQALLGLPLLGGRNRANDDEYTLIRDRLDLGHLIGDLVELKVSRLIGIEGGKLSLAGHTLTVPPGAVNSPVLFTLQLLPTGIVEVDMTAAKALGILGRVLNISQFSKPLTLELSYARSPNVPDDPSRMLIVYAPGLLGYRNLQPMPSEVDAQRKVVRATIDHFSRFCMASN